MAGKFKVFGTKQRRAIFGKNNFYERQPIVFMKRAEFALF